MIPQRRLTITDTLILVAAAGGGFAFARDWLGRYGQRNGPYSGYETFVVTACWAALAISIALIPLRLLPPRPRWSSLCWQPGFVACFAVLVSSACATFTHLPFMIEKSSGVIHGLWMYSVVDPIRIGPTIVAMWSLLAISKRWRSEASGIDRAGRAMGFIWIASYVFSIFGHMLL